MRACDLRPLHAAAVVLMLLLGAWGAPAHGQTSAATAQHPDPWPRQMQIAGGTLTVYQPQVDSWDGGFLKFRAAVSVKPGGGGQEVFGVVRASAHTLVDRTARMVSLFDFSLLQIDFPSLPDHGQRYDADLGRLLPAATTRISLDRLQGFLVVQKLTAKTVAVKNDPPEIIVSYRTAVLVPVSGYPVLRTVAGTSYQRVVNTRALILYGPGGSIYLHVYDGWMVANALNGPWRVALNAPAELERHRHRSGEEGRCRPPPGQWEDQAFAGKVRARGPCRLQADRAGRLPGSAAIRADRQHDAALGQQQSDRRHHQHRQQRLLRPDLRALVPGGLAGRPLDLCPGQRSACGFPAHTGGRAGGRDPGLGGGHVPGKGSPDRGFDSPDRPHPAQGGSQLHSGVRWRAAAPPDRRDSAAIRGQFAGRDHRGQSDELLCAAPRRLVRLELGAGSLGRDGLCPGRHLFDSRRARPCIT